MADPLLASAQPQLSLCMPWRSLRWTLAHPVPLCEGSAHQAANSCFRDAAGRGTVVRRRGAILTPVVGDPSSSQQEGVDKAACLRPETRGL